MGISISSSLLVGYVMAMARAGAWLAFSPPFQGGVMPQKVKVGFAAALALALGPNLADHAVPLDTGSLIGAVAFQVMVGVALGFITQMLFAIFQMAGSAIDLFGSFAISQAIDPLNGAQASVFSRFYNILAITLLFATGGHLLLVRGFLTSYEALPIDGFRIEVLAEVITKDAGLLLVAALELAAPLLAALFLTDIALGLLSRAAPEMNVLLLGLPLKIFVTLSLAAVAIPLIPDAVRTMTDTAVRHGFLLSG